MPAPVPTIPTTSSRTSTAASCARCASSARGRTSPISRRRIRSTRSSPRTAARSSSTTCRTSGRRSACATTSTNGTSAGNTSTREIPSRQRFFSFGFALSPWQTVDYVEYPSIGKFEGDRFDPRKWRPQTPTTAYMELRDDDAFWAARRVVAFTDDLIRAAVHTGEYSDPTAEKYLADVLIKRRNKIASIYLTAVNPIVDPASRCERPVDVRERGSRGWRGERPGNLPRLVVSLRQRDGRDASRFQKRRARRRRSRLRAACRRRQAASCAWTSPSIARGIRRGSGRSAPLSAGAAKGWTLVGLERLPDLPASEAGGQKAKK